MRLAIIFTFLLTFSNDSFSQKWMDAIRKDSKMEQPTLFNYQSAFDNYCKKNNIYKGFVHKNETKQKAYGWKQFKRWEHFWETRVNKKTGEFPSELQYESALQQYRNGNIDANGKSRLLNHDARNISGNWQNLGPSSSKGGYAGVGRINQIAFHPTDPNTFWVTTPAGGLWHTSDGGGHWQTLTDGLEVLATSAIAIPSDYASSKTIYLGTGEMISWNHDNGIGVLKSTDGGMTWDPTGLAFNIASDFSVNRILIHPEDNNIIYAATSNGVYQTIDAGESWIWLFHEKYIGDLEFNPADPSILYASSRYWGRIYKLANDGTSASIVYDEYNAAVSARRIELAVSPDSPNVVYAIVVNEDNGLKELVKSTDNGSNFTTIYTPEPSFMQPNILSRPPDGDDTGGQGYYDLALVVDPNDSNTLYCGGINTWKSNDGGLSWTLNNFWTNWGCGGCEIVHADKHFLAYNNNSLYECNDGGLYRTNNGVDWDNISNGIVNSQMYKLGVSQTQNNITITGLQDNGTKLLNMSGDWEDVIGGDGMECIIDYTDHNVQYGSLYYGAIHRTRNSWNNSIKITPSEAGDGAWVTPYLIDPNDANILYAGYSDVWKTMDQGNNWSQISDLNTSNVLQTLAVAPSNDMYIYTSNRDTMWRTTDGGIIWEVVNNNLPLTYNRITSIIVHQNDPNIVWLSLGGFNTKIVYKSLDGGEMWTNMSIGLPSIPANVIIQNKQNTIEDELYLGTDYGVYVKLGDRDWTLFSSGMPKVVVDDLDIYYDNDPEKSILRAATYGRGLWESEVYKAEVPVANFTANTNQVSLGEMVYFTDLSTNEPSHWNWVFEGGFPDTSELQNPTVIYNQVGSFQVQLSSINVVGEHTIIKQDYIEVVCDYEQSEHVSICPGDDYTFPDGTIHTHITTSEHYTSSLISHLGCDSIIITNIEIKPEYSFTNHVSICEGEDYIFPDSMVLNHIISDTTYISHLISHLGCDSIIHTNIEVQPDYYINVHLLVCEGEDFVFPDGTIKNNITLDTSATSFLISHVGCDSIIEIVLTVNPTYDTSEHVVVCFGDDYIFPDGTLHTNISLAEHYTSAFITHLGCDSTLTSYIEVDMIDTDIVQDESTLSSVVEGMDYQWIDCDDNFAIIEDATNQDFIPTASGNYALIIGDSICIDTSDCYELIISAVEDIVAAIINIYPNPSSDELTIDFGIKMDTEVLITIYNIEGSSSLETNLESGSQSKTIAIGNLVSGLYFIEIQDSKKTVFKKLVVVD